MKTSIFAFMAFLSSVSPSFAGEEGKCKNVATLAASAFKETYLTGQLLKGPAPEELKVIIFSNLHITFKSSKPSNGDQLETYLVEEENTHTRPYAMVEVESSQDGSCFLKSIKSLQ